MDYVLKPSLERMALAKMAVALWDEEGARATMAIYLRSPMSHRETREVWLKSEDKVIEKVSRLLLPEPLKKKLLKFISGIGWEIFQWRDHLYFAYKYLDLVRPSDLCWTPYGTVDRKKTAEALLQNESIDVTRRYRLACHNCLEADIPKLWDKIPENLREQFYSDKERDFLVVLWTYHAKGELDKISDVIERFVRDDIWDRSSVSPNQRAFIYASSEGHKAASEYFLQRLTHEEKKRSLVKAAKRASYHAYNFPLSYGMNVLGFLFSQMDDWEQIQLLKQEVDGVLKCFLVWPWQSLFMETANRVWELYPGSISHVLLAIVRRVKEGHRDCDYRNLFGEFWQQSPQARKKHVMKDEIKGGECHFSLLLALLEIEDIENVGLILNSATVDERRDLIFSFSGNDFWGKYLDNTNKWDSLKLFFQEFLSFKEGMTEFEDELKGQIVRKMSERPAKHARKKCKWDQFFQILDDLIQDSNIKRSAEEAGESTSAKSLRGTEFEGGTRAMKKTHLEE